jgi:hypothetical protein
MVGIEPKVQLAASAQLKFHETTFRGIRLIIWDMGIIPSSIDALAKSD